MTTEIALSAADDG